RVSVAVAENKRRVFTAVFVSAGYRLLLFSRRLFLPNRLKIRKISLPSVAIPGIPRLHVATALPGIGNYIASSHFQRSRARAGAGPFGIASCELQPGDQEGFGPSDY